MTLDSLPPGQRAIVVGFLGDDPITVRLGEMGVLPGETIEVTRVAPLGDPLAVRVGGSLLAVRRREAAFVQVESGRTSAATNAPAGEGSASRS